MIIHCPTLYDDKDAGAAAFLLSMTFMPREGASSGVQQ